MILNFTKGQRVRKYNKTQEMIVGDYQKVTKKGPLSVSSVAKFVPKGYFTGNVWCTMVGDSDNGRYYDQTKLVLVEN